MLQNLRTELESKLAKLEVQKKEEALSNSQLLSSVERKPINYHQEVQFLHVSSQFFLSSSLSASESEKNAYKLILSNDFSSSMIFKILPLSKSN